MIKSIRKDKKGIGAFNLMKVGAVGLGVAFIITALMTTVLTEMTPAADTTNEYTNTSRELLGNGTSGMVKLASFGTTMGIVLAITILLGLVALIKFNKK